MILPLLLHSAGLGVLTVLPGYLIHRAWLRHAGLSWRACAGLVFAAQTVLLTNLAAVAGYRFGVALVVLAGLLAGVALAAYRTHAGRQPADVPLSLAEGLFQALIMMVFLGPALVLFLPLDTDAQGFGHIALMVREGGTITTLAPFQPDVAYLYSAAPFVWWAFFSDLFSLPLHQVMLPFSHLVAGFTALLSIDLGQWLAPGRPRMRWLYPLMVTAGLGLFLSVMDSAYTSVLAVCLIAVFLIFAAYAISTGGKGWLPPALAAVPLAGVALSHPDTILILLIGYVPFYATYWLVKVREEAWQTWLRFFVWIPAIGVLLTIPWTLRALPLFFEDQVISPFQLSLRHWRLLVLYQGVLVPALALIGVGIAAVRRSFTDVLMLTWAVFVIDFSMFGLAERLFLPFGIDIMRYMYPHSIAWRGPILPWAYLAASALDGILARWPPITLTERRAASLCGAGLAAIGLLVAFNRPVLAATRPYLSFFGAFSSRPDLAALAYLRQNTPADGTLILNYPLGFEGHWVMVISEREAVVFRDQPFFHGAEPYYARMEQLETLYFDLAQPGAYEAIREHGITHVFIPQIVTYPERYDDVADTIRWRWPEQYWQPLLYDPAQVEWLTLAYEAGGARVYAVRPAP